MMNYLFISTWNDISTIFSVSVLSSIWPYNLYKPNGTIISLIFFDKLSVSNLVQYIRRSLLSTHYHTVITSQLMQRVKVKPDVKCDKILKFSISLKTKNKLCCIHTLVVCITALFWFRKALWKGKFWILIWINVLHIF